MTDQSEVQEVSAETTGQMPAEVTETEQAETEIEEEFSIETVERKFFPPDQLEAAAALISQIQSVVEPDMIRFNFDPDEQEVPDGYGLATVPISERQPGGKGNMTVGIVIAAVPDPELIANHEKGQGFIRDVVQDYFLAKVANAARPKATGVPTTLPFSVDDYIERRRGRESLKTFTEIAPLYVKALREKGLKMLTQALLRQILQSKVFAEQFNRNLEERNFWSGVLDKMIAKASSKSLDPAVLANWKATRDQVQAIDVSELDVDELDEMVA